MANNKTKRKNVSSLTCVYEDNRFPDQAITWKQGSGELWLCQKGASVGTGGAVVLKRVPIAESATWDEAQEEANKWWNSIDFFEDDENFEEE